MFRRVIRLAFFLPILALLAWMGWNMARPGDETMLPCGANGPLRAQNVMYCALGRNHLDENLMVFTRRVADQYHQKTGTPLIYFDASGDNGKPLWPHLSHGSGKQIDIALPFKTKSGKTRIKSPTWLGYGSYEPPREGETRACGSQKRSGDFGDPPKNRNWKLDEDRARLLIDLFIGDASVRRVFIAPHLAKRLGYADHPKVRFAGCHAARHDDHIHVDFF